VIILWLGELTYGPSFDTQPIVVELEDLDGIKRGACQQWYDRFHSSGTKGIIAEIKFSQAGLCTHYSITKSNLGKKKGRFATSIIIYNHYGNLHYGGLDVGGHHFNCSA
jgi:hypothetical protein